MNVKFFLFCMIVTIIMFFLVWGIAKLTLKDKTMVGAFAQAGARGSAAILGVAFVEIKNKQEMNSCLFLWKDRKSVV